MTVLAVTIFETFSVLLVIGAFFAVLAGLVLFVRWIWRSGGEP